MNGELFSINDAAAFVAAIDAELDQAARASAALVRKGRLSPAESGYVVGLLRDVRSDLAHAFGPMDPGGCLERPDPAVRWRDKVRWIRQELETRERDYPELVAKGRITPTDMRLKIRMLRTLGRLYWRELFMWEPDPGPALDFLLAIRRSKIPPEDLDRAIPGGRELYRELVRRHAASLELEESGQMELVA
jgi:hypothetical protein